MYKGTKVITGKGTRLIDVRGLFPRIVRCDQMNRFADVEFAEYVCCQMETVLEYSELICVPSSREMLNYTLAGGTVSDSYCLLSLVLALLL